jgi:excisionase family DNA binding protein
VIKGKAVKDYYQRVAVSVVPQQRLGFVGSNHSQPIAVDIGTLTFGERRGGDPSGILGLHAGGGLQAPSTRCRRGTNDGRSRKLLTLDEAAAFLGVSKVSLRRWTNDGVLGCHRLGPQGRRRFALEQLKRFAKRDDADVRPEKEAQLPLHCLGSNATATTRRHVYLFFCNPIEQWEAFRRHFLHHYRQRQQIFYMHSASTTSRLADWLTNQGIDFDETARSGLLRLVPADHAYLKPGSFSAGSMLAFVRRAIIGMKSEGFAAPSITGEMNRYFSMALGVEEIHKYERRLNLLLDEVPKVTIVCQYDISRFNPEAMLEACCSSIDGMASKSASRQFLVCWSALLIHRPSACTK